MFNFLINPNKFNKFADVIFKPLIVITKHCVDFYLIAIILLIFLFAIKSLYKELLINKV